MFLHSVFPCPVLPHTVGSLPSARQLSLRRVGAVLPWLAADHSGVAVRLVVDRQTEDALEGYAPPVTAMEAERVLLQVAVEVLGAEAVEGAHASALHQCEDAVNPEEVGGHFADDPLVEDVALGLRPLVESEIGAVPIGQQRRARRDV